MEVALSAFLGEIASRSISFFIGKLSKHKAEEEDNLRRKLLRIRIIVQEAERRQIRTQAMLDQLKILQAAMYGGHYALDASKYDQAHHQCNKDVVGNVSRHSFAISNFNPAKRIRIQLCSSHSGGKISSQAGDKTLRQVLGCIEATITDAAEFVVFLNGCSPLHRCLYSAHMDLENCMFDRHVEMEHVVNFVLAQKYYSPAAGCCTEDHPAHVLPIVGPGYSGKTTLIEYVCRDERVRNAFSRILFFAEDDLQERVSSPVTGGGGGDTVKYCRSHISKEGENVLVIVEVNGDISEAAWRRLTRCSASATRPCARTNGVTKIVVCSRSDKIARFGTTSALKIGYLTQEAYWYFFKALALGSMDPEEHPELASLAMEIATCLKRSFIAGNVIARMLRDNPSAKFWRMALSCFKDASERYEFQFGAHPVSPLHDKRLLVRLNGSNKEYCSISNGYQIVSAQDDAPTTTIQQVLSGSAVLRGKSNVLAWRSSIPPYYGYTASCEINEVS